jgi:hypothetical protein
MISYKRFCLAVIYGKLAWLFALLGTARKRGRYREIREYGVVERPRAGNMHVISSPLMAW